MAGALVALAIVSSSPMAAADHRALTLNVDPSEAKRGTVLAVSGEYCEFGGKALQGAVVYLFDRHGGWVDRYYAVRSDGSWSGEFVIPHSGLTGSTTIAANCYADDMVFGGPERPFQILDGEATTLAANTSSAPPAATVPLTGSDCTTQDGRALASAAAYLAEPWTSSDHSRPPPLPAPVLEATVGSDGAWQGDLTVPSALEPGDYEMWARCWDSTTVLETARQKFTIARPSSPTTISSRPGASASGSSTTSTTTAPATTTSVEAPTTLDTDADEPEVANGKVDRPSGGQTTDGSRLLLGAGFGALLAVAAAALMAARRRGLLVHWRRAEQT